MDDQAIDIQYIYIVKNKDEKFVLKGSKSTKAFEKIAKKVNIYGIFPTVNAESDRSVLYQMYYNMFHTKEFDDLDDIQIVTKTFYNNRYAKFQQILKQKELYKDYLE
jgi:hypothetical protein